MSGWDTCFLSGFFHRDLLAGILSSDSEVILAAADYLKAYAIDCIFTAVFFCYIGFYNGIGMTRFVIYDKPGHADTIVETDVTEKHRRENTVDRICFQIIGRCQDHLGIGRKDTRQKISMEKAG